MSENRQTTDSELLLQIVGYNSEAFEQLYNRYSATIYSLIKEIVTNPKLAEKILLNVFSVFLKRIDYYSTTSNDIFTWLTLLARNISIDSLKRMKLVEDLPIYSDEYEIEYILPNISQMINPINLDERTELGEKIKSYKTHLSEVQNLVLSLVYFEGLNEEEIAKRLSVPVVTVRQKILSIMESLHHQHTGQTENVKSNKEILDLIKLEALGCLSSKERTLINKIRKNDPEFLWKELGEFQNLTALLSTPIPIQKPGNELGGEIRKIFTKILQGSEVEYPKATPEPEATKQHQKPTPESEVIKQSQDSTPKPEVVIEKHQKSTPEPIQQQIQNPIPEVIKQPEILEKKKPEFELKFRDRDPKGLSFLKKSEIVELNQKTSAAFAKTNSEIKLKDYNEPLKRRESVVSKKEDFLADKKPIPIASKTEDTSHHQTTPVDIIKTGLKIENDDPSIIIEEPKPKIVKEEVTVKNRLIPNSSINLKELFKKEERNIADKESIPVKIKEENIVENPPVVPVVAKPDIIIKTNEPSKELRRSNVFVDEAEKLLESKPLVPTIEIPGTVNKINTVVVKEEKKVEENPATPVVEKSDIKIKTNEPPTEFRRNNVFVDKYQKTVPSKPIVPVVEKSESENKKNDPVKEIHSSNVLVTKEEKPVELKTPQAVQKIDIKTVAQESQSQNEKINPDIKKDQNLFEHIKPAVDKSNLKIRETVFTENEKKSEITKQERSTPAVESKIKTEKVNPASKLTEAINIDEILSKIEDEKSAPALLGETESYEKEAVTLRKKIRRNILVSAAIFVILVASSLFVYLSFQEAPVKVADNVSNSEKVNLAGQTNLVFNNEYKPGIETENPVETSEAVISEKPLINQKVVILPLPEISVKEESTLFASNINESLMSDINNETTQTAAAKTENIIPPKEEKIVEEEPAFFVAVEEMPELIGGIKGLQSKIIYPEIAKRVGTEGKVIVQAIVDESGNVTSVSTLKGIGSGCDEVAMDAVRNSKFTPGKQRGKTVKTQITIPIVFKK